MKELFIPYELALLAKDKGFNEGCLGWYNSSDGNDYELLPVGQTVKLFEEALFRTDINSRYDNREIYNSDKYRCSAPLYQQITDWFRVKHNIRIVDGQSPNSWCSRTYYKFHVIKIDGCSSKDILFGRGDDDRVFDEYYEAYNFAIDKAFKNI